MNVPAAVLLFAVLVTVPVRAQELELLATDDFINPTFLAVPSPEGPPTTTLTFLTIGGYVGAVSGYNIRDRFVDGAVAFSRITTDLYIPVRGATQAVQVKWHATLFDDGNFANAARFRSRFKVGMYGEDASDKNHWVRMSFFWDFERLEDNRDIHETGVEIVLKFFGTDMRWHMVFAYRFGPERPVYGAFGLEVPVIRWSTGSVFEVGASTNMSRDDDFLAEDFDGGIIAVRARAALRIALPIANTWLHVTYAPGYRFEAREDQHEFGAFLEVPLGSTIF